MASPRRSPLWPLALAMMGCSPAMGSDAAIDDAPRCAPSWTASAAPLIAVHGTVVWNDPSVLRTETGYRMWLTRGQIDESPIRVSVHTATSPDGTAWEVEPAPVLAPGPPGSWDETRIETPSVVHRDDGYHLYYSGCAGECNDGRYAIGHATSSDGLTWLKDPNNPVITPLETGFGVYTAAEPGAVVDPRSGDIFVYYTGAGTRGTTTIFGILLATTSDGSTFVHHADSSGRIPVLLPSDDYPESEGYWGYSTPSPIAVGDEIVLFHDVVQRLSDIETFGQVAFASARSTDGRTFTEWQPNLLTRSAWFPYVMVSPSVVPAPEPGRWLLYFAGFVDVYDTGFAEYTGGVGVASTPCLFDP